MKKQKLAIKLYSITQLLLMEIMLIVEQTFKPFIILNNLRVKYLHFGLHMKQIWFELMKDGKFLDTDLCQEVLNNNKKGIK